MVQKSKTQYSRVAIALHWLMALLIIPMVLFGEEMMEIEREAGNTIEGILSASIHVSIGLSIFILSLVRLAWRIANPPPPYPSAIKSWEKAMAKGVVVLFYCLMIGLPVSGWLAFSAELVRTPELNEVLAFGMIAIPTSPISGLPADDIHNAGSKIALVLIALHVIAALKHQLMDDVDVFGRMRPKS